MHEGSRTGAGALARCAGHLHPALGEVGDGVGTDARVCIGPDPQVEVGAAGLALAAHEGDALSGRHTVADGDVPLLHVPVLGHRPVAVPDADPLAVAGFVARDGDLAVTHGVDRGAVVVRDVDAVVRLAVVLGYEAGRRARGGEPGGPGSGRGRGHQRRHHRGARRQNRYPYASGRSGHTKKHVTFLPLGRRAGQALRSRAMMPLMSWSSRSWRTKWPPGTSCDSCGIPARSRRLRNSR